MTISEIIQKYTNKLDYLDLEILIANSLVKTREFVLTYPEYKLTKFQISNFKFQINRRLKGEPIAYILGHKEFYGLDFIVNKHTLVPRPETEQMVELVLSELKVESLKSKAIIMDIGTGSGNIITSIASSFGCHPEFIFKRNERNEKEFLFPSECRKYDNISGSSIAKQKPSEILKQVQNDNIKYFAIDISKNALKIAKKNARLNNVDKKIKFLHGDLLKPFLKAKKLPASTRGNDRSSTRGGMPNKLIITANLPYLSKNIYDSAPIDVKKFEPKSALYSPEAGLQHYRKLLEQIKKLPVVSCQLSHVTCFLEISPEQKQPLTKLIKSIFPKTKPEFKKDLAGKWRVCKIEIK